MKVYNKAKKTMLTAFAATALGVMTLFSPAGGDAQESRKFQNDVEESNFNSASLREISLKKIFGEASLESGFSVKNRKYENEPSKTTVKAGAETWYPLISGPNVINAGKLGYSVSYSGENGGVLHDINMGYGLAYAKRDYSFIFGSEVSLKGVSDLNFDNLSLQFISNWARSYSAGIIADIGQKGLDYITIGFDYSNPKEGFGISTNVMKSIRRDGTEDRPSTTITVGFDKRLSDRKVDAWSLVGTVGVSDFYRYYLSNYNGGEYSPNNEVMKEDKQLVIFGDAGVRKKFLHDNGFFDFRVGVGSVTRHDARYAAPKKNEINAKMTVGFKL